MQGRTDLHIFRVSCNAKPRDEVLQNDGIPHMAANPHLQMLQHDNARPHTASLTMAYLDQQHISVLAWPSL